MPRWIPTEEWRDTDAYVIGGGNSLQSFQWESIAGKNTIGCNSAFLLGARICKIVLWADIIWWQKIGKKGTEDFGGRVVGAPPRRISREDDRPWLYTMERADSRELSRDRLCLFSNTGAMAINLALILGAARVYLLGFDMQLGQEWRCACGWKGWQHELKDGPGGRVCPDCGGSGGLVIGTKTRPNYHDLRHEKGTADVYTKFQEQMRAIPASLKRVFPGRQIINLHDGTSKLTVFPSESLREHFSRKAKSV